MPMIPHFPPALITLWGTAAVETNLQEDIDSLCAWSAQNRMFLNARKTKSILVTGKRLKSHQKLLGVTIGQQLTFKKHVDKLCKKLSKKIGLLKKFRAYLPIDERRLFYNALIKPVMMHGSIVWTYCSNEDLKRVFRLQKRAARVILGAGIRDQEQWKILRNLIGSHSVMKLR